MRSADRALDACTSNWQFNLAAKPHDEAASRLLSDLIAYGMNASISPIVLANLRDDLAVFDPDAAHDYATHAENKKESSGLPSNAQSNSRFWRGLGLASSLIFVLCATAAFFYFDQLRGPAPSISAAEIAPETREAEIMPQVGAGQHLDVRGVRYCKYQEARLLLMKPQIRSKEDTAMFNKLAADYNSRCSDFFFRDADLDAVQTEMDQMAPRFAADVKQLMSTWQAHTGQ